MGSGRVGGPEVACGPEPTASFESKLGLASGERQRPAKPDHHHAAAGTHM